MATDEPIKKVRQSHIQAASTAAILLAIRGIVGWLCGTRGSEKVVLFARWVQIFSGAFFLWATLAVLGFEIQTFNSSTPAEKLNRRLFKYLNSAGMFFLFSGSFAVLFHTLPGPLESPVVDHENVNSPSTNRIFDASEFVLRDENGKVRATLGFEENQPALIFQDANGTDRITIMDLPGFGPAIALGSFGKGKGPHLTLGVTSDGAAIELADQQGVTRATMETNGDKPTIKLLDSNGKERATMGATNIETKVDGSVTNRPESSLVLFDKEGNVIWKTPP